MMNSIKRQGMKKKRTHDVLPSLQQLRGQISKPEIRYPQYHQVRHININQFLQPNKQHKPYSGNPNTKSKNNMPLGNNIKNPKVIPPRDILSANPTLITKLFYNPHPFSRERCPFSKSLPKNHQAQVNVQLSKNFNINLSNIRKRSAFETNTKQLLPNFSRLPVNQLRNSNQCIRQNKKILNDSVNNKSSVHQYSYQEEKNLEHRKSMEDYHQIIDDFCNDKTKGYYAIFDGHSGQEPAIYCKDHLHNILSKCLYSTNFNVEKSLNHAFNKIDEELKAKLKTNDSGTTATVALIYQEFNSKTQENQKFLYCANVGDSRCYLVSSNGRVKQMTTDHKCSNSSEVERIKKSGGIVFSGRVFGTLALTRTLGDIEMKKYGVLATPSISKHVLSDDDLYLILASDGVWDVVTEDDLKTLCASNINADSLGKRIVNMAMERDSRDNISCIAIKF